MVCAVGVGKGGSAMEPANLERDAFQLQKRVDVDADASRSKPTRPVNRNAGADDETLITPNISDIGGAGVKQTLNKHGSHNIEKMIYDAMVSGGSEILAFRVPTRIKMLYIALPRSRRRAVKEVVVKTIEQLAQAHVERSESPNVIINMNVNIAEARVSTAETRSIDVDLLKEKLKVAEERARDYKGLMEYYKSKCRDLENKLQSLKQLVSLLEQSLRTRNYAQALKIAQQLVRMI